MAPVLGMGSKDGRHVDLGIIISVLGIVVTAWVTYRAAMAGVQATIRATQEMNRVAAAGHKIRLIEAIQKELLDLEAYLKRTPQLGLPPMEVLDVAVFENTVADQTRLFGNLELINECHELRHIIKKLNLLLGIGNARHVNNQDNLTHAALSHWPGTNENCQRSITKIRPLLASEFEAR